MSLVEKLPWVDKRPRNLHQFSPVEQRTLKIVNYFGDSHLPQLFSELLFMATKNHETHLPLPSDIIHSVESLKSNEFIQKVEKTNGLKEIEYLKLTKRGKDALIQIRKQPTAFRQNLEIRILSEERSNSN